MDGPNPAPLGNHAKPFFIGIHRGIIIPIGFLGGAKWISSIHSIAALKDDASGFRSSLP